MADIWIDVDTAVTVPVNKQALIDDTDFKTREESVTYNQAGLDLVWNFITAAGVMTQTAVTPTDTAGVYDWTNVGNGMYKIEIPASGGGTINNDTEGFGWFTGFATGILPWCGPICGFRAAGLNDALIESAWSATRGLAGTALPAAAADAAGGLPISDAGGLDIDAKLANTNEVTAARMGALTDWINGGRLDLLMDAIKAVTDALPNAGALTDLATAANLATAAGYIDTEITTLINRLGAFTGTGDNTVLGILKALASKAAATPSDIGGTFDPADDSLEAIRDAGASLTDLGIIASTTIATLASQTSFTLTAGSADDNAYNNCRAIITDATTAVQKATATILDYTGATKTVTLSADPGVFTMAANDLITILPPAASGFATAAALATAQADLDILTGADGAIIASGTQTFNMTGNVTGNLSGSVGSVTGAVGSVTGAVGSVTGLTASNLDAAISSRSSHSAADVWSVATRVLTAGTNLNNLSAAEVLTQVNAAIDTAIAELGVAAPTATPTLRTGLMLLYMALRNKTTSTATTQTISNNAGTTIASAALSDDGDTFERAEMA